MDMFSITRHTEDAMLRTAYPGFISSQASNWLDLGASVPCSTFPVSVWMTLTGSSLIWLFSSMGCMKKKKHESRFSLTGHVRLGLTELVYQKEHTSVGYSHLLCFHFHSNLLTSPSGPMAPIPSASPASFWRLNMTEINKHGVFNDHKNFLISLIKVKKTTVG